MAEELAQLGRRVARRFIIRGIRPKPSDLAKQMGVEVILQDKPPPAQARLRSEYRADPPRVIVYRHSITQLQAAAHANQRIDMMRCYLTDEHIANELFHHLEFGGRFGPFSPKEIEEVAHGFTQELCALDFHPTEFSEMVG